MCVAEQRELRLRGALSKISPRAFTLIELVVVAALVVLLASLLLPALKRAKARAARIHCTCNLKQVGMAFKTWSLDYSNNFPMQLRTNPAGLLRGSPAADVFRYFQVMSNELSTPIVLLCPADTRSRAPDFGAGFSNTNISYFVGLDATDGQPQMFLAGDRNLSNGAPVPNGIMELRTNSVVQWTRELHRDCGQVLLADGSVEQLNNSNLTLSVQNSGGTNHLAIP